MHYLLNEEEFRELTEMKELLKTLPSTAELQRVCTKVASTLPIKIAWGREKGQMAPWGCILLPDSIPYCDDCPVKTICPHPHKNWSK